jgi:hypothetical protein
VAGTVTLVLLLDRTMTALPDGAGADKVIVQFADPGAVTVPGEQVKDEGKTTPVKLTVADCCTPLSVAVTLTLCAPLRVPVVAAKVALLWPVAMVTLAGTVSAVALLLIATTVELVAALLSETVQVLDALLPKLEGAQDTDVSCAGTVAERLKDGALLPL